MMGTHSMLKSLHWFQMPLNCLTYINARVLFLFFSLSHSHMHNIISFAVCLFAVTIWKVTYQFNILFVIKKAADEQNKNATCPILFSFYSVYKYLLSVNVLFSFCFSQKRSKNFFHSSLLSRKNEGQTNQEYEKSPTQRNERHKIEKCTSNQSNTRSV